MVLAVGFAPQAAAQTLALDSLDGLTFHHTKAEVVTHQGLKGIRVVGTEPISPAPAARPGAASEAAGRPGGPRPAERPRPLVVIDGAAFSNGTIELELAGKPREGAPGQARGFVGVAFRVAPDLSRYEVFYIRPENGRADDQLRRNHSVQYISYPDFEWMKLRQEFPGVYETYADMVPGEWIKMKIEVNGDKARLCLHGQEQPTLLVNDLKMGAAASGGVALWLENSTEAHFRNLKITK